MSNGRSSRNIAYDEDIQRDSRTTSLEGMIERGEMFTVDGIEDSKYSLTDIAAMRLNTEALASSLNNRDRMILRMRLNGSTYRQIALELYPLTFGETSGHIQNVWYAYNKLKRQILKLIENNDCLMKFPL